MIEYLQLLVLSNCILTGGPCLVETPKSAPENGINDLDHPEISDGFQISVWERYVRC